MERNEPCWCGSGKKYKKCHMPIDEKNTASRRPRGDRSVKSDPQDSCTDRNDPQKC